MADGYLRKTTNEVASLEVIGQECVQYASPPAPPPQPSVPSPPNTPNPPDVQQQPCKWTPFIWSRGAVYTSGGGGSVLDPGEDEGEVTIVYACFVTGVRGTGDCGKAPSVPYKIPCSEMP